MKDQSDFFSAVGVALLLVLIVLGAIVLMAYPVKWSWNYVMPYLFGFKEIGFLHAFCLNFLAASFFKNYSFKGKK